MQELALLPRGSVEEEMEPGSRHSLCRGPAAAVDKVSVGARAL